MIYVSRDRLDEKGQPIRPSQAWFDKAQKATQQACSEGPGHTFQENIFRDPSVKMALEELFFQKCAYCEIQQENMEVEHFRPKGAVAGAPAHPGYYWLAYTWENLYPSCPFCNQKRIDYPTWRDSEKGASAGKSTQFPLQDESRRVAVPTENLADEACILLDPCRDKPERHYTVNPFTGDLVGQDERGEVSIKVYNLNRKRLRNLRLEVLRRLWSLLQDNTSGQLTPAIKQYMASPAQFAGACRALVTDPRT